MKAFVSGTSGVTGRAVLAAILNERGEFTSIVGSVGRVLTLGAGDNSPVYVVVLVNKHCLGKLTKDAERVASSEGPYPHFDFINDSLRIQVLRARGPLQQYVLSLIRRALKNHVKESTKSDPTKFEPTKLQLFSDAGIAATGDEEKTGDEERTGDEGRTRLTVLECQELTENGWIALLPTLHPDIASVVDPTQVADSHAAGSNAVANPAYPSRNTGASSSSPGAIIPGANRQWEAFGAFSQAGPTPENNPPVDTFATQSGGAFGAFSQAGASTPEE